MLMRPGKECDLCSMELVLGGSKGSPTVKESTFSHPISVDSEIIIPGASQSVALKEMHQFLKPQAQPLDVL